ncbi:MAG: hypothetical protein ACRD8W_24690 [Nitrososphaeraceae archaeon]
MEIFENEKGDQVSERTSQHEVIPDEFADPKCPLCDHIIQQVNEIFEQDNIPCPDPREYCMSHLLEAVHTSLIWRLSKL